MLIIPYMLLSGNIHSSSSSHLTVVPVLFLLQTKLGWWSLRTGMTTSSLALPPNPRSLTSPRTASRCLGNPAWLGPRPSPLLSSKPSGQLKDFLFSLLYCFLIIVVAHLWYPFHCPIAASLWATVGRRLRTTWRPRSTRSKACAPTPSTCSWCGRSTPRASVTPAPCQSPSGHKVWALYSDRTLKILVIIFPIITFLI